MRFLVRSWEYRHARAWASFRFACGIWNLFLGVLLLSYGYWLGAVTLAGAMSALRSALAAIDNAGAVTAAPAPSAVPPARMSRALPLVLAPGKPRTSGRYAGDVSGGGPGHDMLTEQFGRRQQAPVGRPHQADLPHRSGVQDLLVGHRPASGLR
jgi:hypothetical protein